MANKNYLTELRDYYIDRPGRVLRRFLVIQAIVIVIHFLFGGQNHVAAVFGTTLIFVVAWISAFYINRNWPRTNFE